MDRIIDTINIVGLLFGLVGAIIVFIFGIPKRIDTGGYGMRVTEQIDPKEEKKINQYKFFGNLGLFFITLSFLFQIASELMSFGYDSASNKPQTIIYVNNY